MASTSAAHADETGRSRERGTGVGALLARVDDVQAQRPWLAVPVATVKKFGEDRAGNLAGLLAYYGFFSLFPLLLVLVTVLGMVLSGNEDLQERIVDSALAQFPVIGNQLREDTGRLDSNGFALAIGLGSALWAGTGVMKAAEDAMNDVWDVPMRERPPLYMAVLRALGMLVVLGGGIILTTLLTGYAGGVASGGLARAAGAAVSAVLNVAIFLLGFRILTVRDVSLRQLLPGAILAGVAWVVLQVVGAYLVNRYVKGASQTYGTFAVVIGFLWWLYLQARITLYAAELNVVLADRLWPRSLRGVATEADRRTLRRHAEVEERYEPQDVRVGFHRGDDRAGAKRETSAEPRDVRLPAPDEGKPDRHRSP